MGCRTSIPQSLGALAAPTQISLAFCDIRRKLLLINKSRQKLGAATRMGMFMACSLVGAIVTTPVEATLTTARSLVGFIMEAVVEMIVTATVERPLTSAVGHTMVTLTLGSAEAIIIMVTPTLETAEAIMVAPTVDRDFLSTMHIAGASEHRSWWRPQSIATF